MDGGSPDGGRRDDGGTKADAGSSDARLEALAGRYLMRWDVLGTASSQFVGVDIRIRSRLSTLVVAELTVDGGKLTSKERVCTQVAAQKCESICNAASTVVDPRVVSEFLAKRTQTRAFTLAADGTFAGGRSVAQLGYDDPDPEAVEPTTPDDPRLWDVVPGNPREGFLSQVSVSALGLIDLSCKSYGTQRYVTLFRGKLGGSDSAPQIPQMELDLADSNAVRLGSDNPTCAGQEVDVPVDISNARMVRYGDELSEDAFWACPAASVFETMMPGTEPELDQP